MHLCYDGTNWNASGTGYQLATTTATTQSACDNSTNLSDTANLAYLNVSNTFTGATNTFAAITGTTINATSGFKVGGVALSASNLSNGVSGTGAICLASGSACGGSPFAGTGIPYATSTTVSTVATSPQLVSALNNTPSTTLAVALLPLATTGAFGAVKPDGTTVTIVGGVISANGTAGFTSGSNSNGYWEKDPTGRFDQWNNHVQLTSSSTDEYIAFPVAFTNVASINVLIQSEMPVSGVANVGYMILSNHYNSPALDVTVNGFYLHQAGFTSQILNWRATGY